MGAHPGGRSRSCEARRFLPNHRWSPLGGEAASRRQQYLESTPNEKAGEDNRRPQTTSVTRRASQGAWQWYRGLAPAAEAASTYRRPEGDSV